MKRQLNCIALLALISFISTASLVGDRLNFEGESIFSAGNFVYEVNKLFKDQKVILRTIDLSGANIYQCGYWNLIDSINSTVDKEVESISVIFGSLPSYLKELKYDNILAEMAIVSQEIPRVVPDFDANSLDFKNYAYEAYTRMHNTKFDEYLTIELPSFNDELEIILDPNSMGTEMEPFVASSELLYDYVFAGVDFSKVKVINLCHSSLFNYLQYVDLSNLEILNFDYSLYYNVKGDGLISIKEYADAILSDYPEKHLVISFDDEASDLSIEGEVEGVKSTYGERFTYIEY